jgi:hypothetical protein
MTREESLSQALRELVKKINKFSDDYFEDMEYDQYKELKEMVKTAEAVLGQEGGKDAQ